MNIDLYKKLHDEGLITEETLKKAVYKHNNPLLSLHWELKTLLYLGVTLLSTGLGILIYKNIDTIGHQFILLFIAAISTGCFYYCIKNRKPFNREQVKSPGSLYDYVLLLGCLSMLSFLGYLQFQYLIFGTHYGMATLIPMLILFYIAYEFDHLGVLSMAITNLAIWMGITASPIGMVADSFKNTTPLIYTGLFLGLFLLVAGYCAEHYNFKKHFKFTYQNFGLNISFISLLSGYFNDSSYLLGYLWLIGVPILGFILYRDALKNKSFYFLLMIILYVYIAASTFVISWLIKSDSSSAFVLCLLYLIGSAIYFVTLLISLNKKIKAL